MSIRRGRGVAARGAPLRVDVARDGGRGGLALADVERAARRTLVAEGVRAGALSVTLVSDARMRRLNRRFLGRAGLTDVIAFPLSAGPGRAAGDVYIAPGAARESARRHAVTVREEMVRLVVHGVLHTLGHDHPDGATRLQSPMWLRQERLVAQLCARRGRRLGR